MKKRAYFDVAGRKLDLFYTQRFDGETRIITVPLQDWSKMLFDALKTTHDLVLTELSFNDYAEEIEGSTAVYAAASRVVSRSSDGVLRVELGATASGTDLMP